MIAYQEFTLRNTGYITEKTQKKIKTTRILVAGCGIGSSFAEAATRLGFQNLILADGDTVGPHNLNRQNFVAEDIGKPKVQALARRLMAINPAANIEQFNACLTAENVGAIVAKADLVFDTIDFLDLAGIVALHDECHRQGKPAITALAVGWGGGAVYFPVGGQCSFRRLFGLPEDVSVANESYVERFAPLVERLAERLDPKVVNVVRKALTVMKDGKPCPASQVSPGAFSVGALGGALAVRIVTGQPVSPAPHLLLSNMETVFTSEGIDLSK